MDADRPGQERDADLTPPGSIGTERTSRFIVVCLAVVFVSFLGGLVWLEPLLDTVRRGGLVQRYYGSADLLRILRGFLVSGLVMSGGTLLLWRLIRPPSGARGLPTRIGLVAVIAAFSVSLAVRWPMLGRSLSDGHESETALALVAMENQRAYPLTDTRLALPLTYPGEANQVISDQMLLLDNPEGVGYYVSYPPFSIILATGLTRILNLPLVPETLRGLNLVCHLVASLLLFLVLLRLLRGSPWRTFSAFVGITFFMFNPAGLWFFSHTYGWAFFWHYLWIISLFVMVRFLDVAERQVRRALWIGLFLSAFCLAYAEAQGVLCVAVYVLYLWGKSRKNRKYSRAALLGAAGAGLALGLTILQYSGIAGFDAFVEHCRETFARRNFLASAQHLRVLRHYVLAYIFLLIPLAFMSLLLLARGGGKAASTTGHGFWRWILLLTGAPVVLHHILFLEWTSVHTFSVVKAIVPLTILITIVIDRVMNSVTLRPTAKSLVLGLLLASVAASLVEHRTVFSYSDDPDRFRRIGEEIARQAAPDEVVFMASEAHELFQVTYYSKRNTRRVEDQEDAHRWMIETGRPHGILFVIDKEGKIVGVERLSIGRPDGEPEHGGSQQPTSPALHME